MKSIVLAITLLAAATALAQQPHQECVTKVYGAYLCNGAAVSPLDMAATTLTNAPSPAYIVRGCLTNNGAMTAGLQGSLWTMGVDRNSIFTNTSGYPASQAGDFTRMIGIGWLDLGAGHVNCLHLNPPVKFTQGTDRIILNFGCAGNVWTVPVIQICWQVNP